MTSRRNEPIEPEPDYEGFVSGRFDVVPTDQSSTKGFDDDAVSLETEVHELSLTMEDESNDTREEKREKPIETSTKFGDRRYVTHNGNNGTSGSAKLNLRTFDSSPKLDLGKDNMSYSRDEDEDSFEPTITRTRRASGSNGSMVLQLVLPQGALRGLSQDSLETASNYPTGTDLSNNEYFTYAPSVIGDGNDNKSRNGDTQYGKANGTRGRFNSSPSVHSEATTFHGHHPPPSTDAEKMDMFRRFNSTIMSCIYAVFLVSLGLVVYVADVLRADATLAASYNLFLVVVGFIYLIYLYFDIRFYVRRAKIHLKATTHYDKEDDAQVADVNMNNIVAPNHGFCFTLGRHAGSFYLKVGAGVFCFGHLIHSGLLLTYEIVFLTSDEFRKCFSPVALTFDIIYPIYSFFQLFFIFKYANVIINHCKELARLLVMHTIGASLCFWAWAIFRESTDSLSRYAMAADNEAIEQTTVQTTTLVSEDGESTVALPLTFYQERGARDLLNFLNQSSFDNECQHAELNVIYDSYSPYLYPFTIEYSILIVGILYIIWDNIGNCKRGGGSSATGVPCPPLAGPEAGSNIILHADCTHTNRGLFAGLLVLVASIVSIILFFVAMTNPQYMDIGKAVNEITELILIIVMTLTSLIAYRQIIRLDINQHPISLLDDILLFIAIPAFFLYAIFTIIPSVPEQDWLKVGSNILVVTQVLIQTALIIDGLRRCSNSKKLRSKTPGRELITFLLICNVALWIIETFEIKSTDRKDIRYEYYGMVLWTILKHMTVPLTMFYRFHSSVCLADIWKSAYEPGEFHH